MHKKILTKEQVNLLPLIQEFSKDFYLVGGTAIALHLGHRRSVDFDLFTSRKVKRLSIKKKLEGHRIPYSIIHEAREQFHILVNSVKITFFEYPFEVAHSIHFDKFITLPSLLDLAAMKAYALGGRAKWKDYVDMYFMLKDHFDISQIAGKAKKLYSTSFNEKLFRQQLCYFEDIDYSEEVIYLKDIIPQEKIKKFLIDVATQEM